MKENYQLVKRLENVKRFIESLKDIDRDKRNGPDEADSFDQDIHAVLTDITNIQRRYLPF